MISLYLHLFWSVTTGLLSVFFFAFFVYTSYSNVSIYLDFPIFSSDSLYLSLSFLFDYRSCLFSFLVLLISSCIFSYSYFYMSPYSKPSYFLWGTFLFVASMLIVINMTNLFYLILGWDGLGLVSFFLIVYFQNSSSISSGVFTLLINRIGDCFFLVTISLFLLSMPDSTSYFPSVPSLLSISMLVITFMTKSAIYPFSPWLPLAIAAPTPISALVHSSTLVTAGLYLIIRFSSIIYTSYSVCMLILVLSLFTSFYAGLNSLFETDMKKLIALSTLSHLGFIGLAFSVGLSDLAFFHMLTHALFNSLLFMCIGDIIINQYHAQDIRFLSSGFMFTPFSSYVMSVSLLNLLGLPMISGFFSKDLVLESLFFSNISFLLHVIVYTNVLFTYFYTYQLLSYSISFSKSPCFGMFHSQPLFHSIFMLVIALISIVFSWFFIKSFTISIKFECVPFLLNSMPLVLNFFILVCLFLFTYFSFNTNRGFYVYIETMLFLQLFWTSWFSNFYVSSLFSLVNSFEMGVINYSLNHNLSSLTSLSSNYLYISNMVSPLTITFVGVLFTFIFLISS